MQYWDECISSALDDAGITATDEQIKQIAGAVAVSHEQYGMAHGYDCIPNPDRQEIDRLKRDIQRERNKVICKTCGGRGRIISFGPIHSCDSQCDKCRGEGRHDP